MFVSYFLFLDVVFKVLLNCFFARAFFVVVVDFVFVNFICSLFLIVIVVVDLFN